MRSILIRTLGTALTVLALPVMTSAQAIGAERADEVRREASGHVGPLYFTPQLHVKELGVDSNADGYFKNPQGIVAVEQYRSQRVFVMGGGAHSWPGVADRRHDAAIAANAANGVVFVGAEMTSGNAGRAAVEHLEQGRAHFVGAVLNRVELERNAYYYSHYYRREYGAYYQQAANAK
jgi:hypothetical protein